MVKAIVKNVCYIVIGAILLGIVYLKLMVLSELLMLLIGIVGFMVLVNGIFGLYNIIRPETEQKDTKQ
jgi:hypothetical protein